MNVYEAISNLLTKANIVAVRPTGLTLTLSRSTWVHMITTKREECARFRAADLLADDWQIETKPREPVGSVEIS